MSDDATDSPLPLKVSLAPDLLRSSVSADSVLHSPTRHFRGMHDSVHSLLATEFINHIELDFSGVDDLTAEQAHACLQQYPKQLHGLYSKVSLASYETMPARIIMDLRLLITTTSDIEKRLRAFLTFIAEENPQDLVLKKFLDNLSNITYELKHDAQSELARGDTYQLGEELSAQDISIESMTQHLRDQQIPENVIPTVLALILQTFVGMQFKVGSLVCGLLQDTVGRDYFIQPSSKPKITISYNDEMGQVHLQIVGDLHYKNDPFGDAPPKYMGKFSAGIHINTLDNKCEYDAIEISLDESCEALGKIQAAFSALGAQKQYEFIDGDDVSLSDVEKALPSVDPLHADFASSAEPDPRALYQTETRRQKIKSQAQRGFNWLMDHPWVFAGIVAAGVCATISVAASTALVASGFGAPLGLLLAGITAEIVLSDTALVLATGVGSAVIGAGLTASAALIKKGFQKLKSTFFQKKPSAVRLTLSSSSASLTHPQNIVQVEPPRRSETATNASQPPSEPGTVRSPLSPSA